MMLVTTSKPEEDLDVRAEGPAACWGRGAAGPTSEGNEEDGKMACKKGPRGLLLTGMRMMACKKGTARLLVTQGRLEITTGRYPCCIGMLLRIVSVDCKTRLIWRGGFILAGASRGMELT